MGSAVGTPTQEEEMDGYFAVKKAYEALSPQQRQESGELRQLATVFQSQQISRRSASSTGDDTYQKENCGHHHFISGRELLALSVDQKLELGKAVLKAVQRKEDGLRAAMGIGDDYGKSISGTKQDTQVENEFASLIRGNQDTKSAEDILPILRPVECRDSQELERLRSAGKWLRYLGAKGCYMWVHSLTREVTPLRPPDYVDEDALVEAGEEEDIAGGYPTCQLFELPDFIKKSVDEDNKTPLLIDNSEDEKVTAFLSYKAILVDVSVLAIGYQKSGTKVSDLMELVRARTVAAMKSGKLLALRLGHLTSEHANFKRKLCVRNVFPADVFQEGGKKMFLPVNKPRCNLMFREEDMEQNQCLVKPDGFRFCAVTSLPPKDIIQKLGETIPLGYMQPVYIIST